MHKGVVLRRVQLDRQYPGLPLSRACGDCTLGVSTGELATTSSEIVQGTVEGTLTITGLPALAVGESMGSDFEAITFRVPADNRLSRSACNCVRTGFG